ncbi:MAG: ferrous iron transport protein B [Myxococcales bacterium]|nr:ferrous iron transport protein B [Myxococcales bacterium]
MTDAPPLRVALAGNPNVGKTSLFNELTGARHKVGNYAGVTVETREGPVAASWSPARPLVVLDLPGIYSLTPVSEDEAVAFRCLRGDGAPAPDLVVMVVDAANLARNLYLVMQLCELGRPLVLALNMTDVAADAGVPVDPAALARALGVPVVATVARTGEGIAALVAAISSIPPAPAALRHRLLAAPLPPPLAGLDPARARWLLAAGAGATLDLTGADERERAALAEVGDLSLPATDLVIARFAEVDAVLAAIGHRLSDRAPAMDRSARIDRVLTHRALGPLIFMAIMAVLFQSIFTWAEPIMGLIESAIGWLAGAIKDVMPEGVFRDLLTEGVVAGVGNVLVFIPQIALLFLFIGLLEDSGYMARAAFLIDRLMARIGLHGKAFVPLLSGYACAIPAILGTRTISSFKDRLVTIMMIPYMSCSARLPVYVLLISAMFDPDDHVGPFALGSVVLLAMYALSTASALAVGAVYKRTLLKSPTPPLVLELPPYRLPRVRNTLLHVYDRTRDFVRDAGTIILAMTVILWALLSFPRPPEPPAHADPIEVRATEGPRSPIEYSLGGRVGKAMEPALEPMGQDFRMGIAILGSFSAREVFVSTLGLVYGIEADDEDNVPLREALRTAKKPAGEPRYSKLSAVALMVFFVYACQCMSTLAVVRRETRSWRWPIVMFTTMTVLAYVMAVLVFQVGRLLGY